MKALPISIFCLFTSLVLPARPHHYFIEVIGIDDEGNQIGYAARLMPRKLAEKYQAICKEPKLVYTKDEELTFAKASEFRLILKQFRKQYRPCDLVNEYPL